MWILYGTVKYLSTGSTFTETSITSSGALDYDAAVVSAASPGYISQVTRFVATTVDVTYSLLANAQTGSGTVTNVGLYARRIG